MARDAGRYSGVYRGGECWAWAGFCDAVPFNARLPAFDAL
jgi:hypothetical protein